MASTSPSLRSPNERRRPSGRRFVRSRPFQRPLFDGLESRRLLAGDGLLGTYFDAIDLSGPALVRVDPTVDFDWGLGSPDPSIDPNTFSARWTGLVEAPETGTYTFYATSDDGVRLWVDGVPLINSWFDRGAATDQTAIALTAGRRYDIRMEYYENFGDAVARLEWSGPGVDRQVIPQSRLSSAPEGLSAPFRPVVKKPAVDGAVVNYSSVLFETLPYADPDAGDAHAATRWRIFDAATGELIWEVARATDETLRVRIALADGEWLGSLAETRALNPDTDYVLRVRYESTTADPATRFSDESERRFRTSSVIVPDPDAPTWEVLQPGFVVERVATGFQMAVNIAFLPAPADGPESPLYYVTELYGSIKVVTRSGSVSDYATGLLNFSPTGDFPGSGEMGVAGIVVDPATGDVFASMLYADGGALHPKVERFRSVDGGLTADSQQTIFAVPDEPMGPSHQISNLTIGPDGKLYVHMGDGFNPNTARDPDSFRGKILRMNLDGTPAEDNPFYDPADGINSRDYIVALGVRNPFGGAWRASDGSHYFVENGPSVDRLARLVPGRDYLYNGSDASMFAFAAYNWVPATAPVNITFVQASTFGGSQFPAAYLDRAFVSLSGPTWATGPVPGTKEISFFDIAPDGAVVGGPQTLVRYDGAGKGTVVALTAGPDGLYFSEFYKDDSFDDPIARGSSLYRVRYVGLVDFAADATVAESAPLTVNFTDLSDVQGATAWEWDFGDGATSTDRNPTHTYTTEGAFDVRLRVTGERGTAEVVKRGFVRVGAFGLSATYFDNADFTGPSVSRFDTGIDFDWGEGSPDPAIGPDTFSARWTGQVLPPASGTYTFYATTDDGFRLWIGDALVIDAFFDQGPTEHAGTIALEAGRSYPIRVEYYENGGGAVARLEWAADGLPREVVPASQLRPFVPPTVTITAPAGGQTLPSGEPLTIAVDASDFDGTVASVAFYAGDVLLGVDDAAPFAFTWESPGVGTYEITAVATDDQGLSTTSASVTVTFVDRIRAIVAGSDPFEGDRGLRPLTFTIQLARPVEGPASVAYRTVDVTALAFADYLPASGRLEFAPGETSRTIRVWILGDNAIEADEVFLLQLSDPVGLELVNDAGIGTIRNDDNRLSVGDVRVWEGDSGTTNAVFTVRLDRPSAFDVAFQYTTVDRTATAGTDYGFIGGQAVIPAGSTSVQLAVPIAGDLDLERDEQFELRLSNPVNARIADDLGVAAIRNDDLRVTIADASIVEGDEGLRVAGFEVTLSAPAPFDLTIPYRTVDLTATAGSDYESSSGSILIPAGETRASVAVAVLGDTLAEGDERFLILPGDVPDARVGRGLALGRILDDDPGSSRGRVAARVEPSRVADNVLIVLEALGDRLDEGDDAFFATLFDPVNSRLRRSRGQFPIADAD